MLNPEKKSRILITGGHATPAIACIDELRVRGFDNLVYVGQKKSILFDKNNSSEYRIITEKIQIPFKNLIAGKFSFYPNFHSVIWLLRLPIGFFQALYFLIALRPNLILTFGSHVGVPIVFWSWLLRIPVIAHEQTTTIGRSNKFIQRLANKVCLSWPSTQVSNYKVQTANEKYILTGNPVRKEILQKSSKEFFTFDNSSKPVLFITGGNQGSHIINEWIFANLHKVTSKYNVIHQTGSNSLFDDYKKAHDIALGINASGIRYIPKNYIFGEEMSDALHQSSFVISRAGANTLIELAILGKKSLLIPIPTSSGNEQFLNAKFISDLGLAKVLDQNNLSSADIVKNLEHLKSFNVDEEKRREFTELHLGAEKRIVDLIEVLGISK